jgi:hypothetical protein
MMKNSIKYITWTFLIVACVVSCDNEYDAERLAEQFCDCMKNNNASKEFNKASDICFDEFIAENRYFKLWNVDMADRELDKKISDDTRDSVKLFFDRFTDYTNTHCCQEVFSCPDSTELK